ncbi:MAG: DUF4331 family protein [Saprospiraceae bacterium]
MSLILCCFFSSIQVFASSHREAPIISNDPLADNTDLYAFRSPDNPNMITIIASYVPFQLPHGGPNYYSFGENIRYEIHIDNNADVPGDEVTYRFTFSQTNEDPTTFFNIRLGAQNLKTTYTLERSMDGGQTFTTILENGIVPPNNIGDRSITSAVGLNTTYDALMQEAILTTSTGEMVFAGPSDDPFFVDLGGVFDLGDSPRQSGQIRDGVGCYNVSTIAIQVPISTLVKAGANPSPVSILDSDYIIGVWASASRPQIRTLTAGGEDFSGDWVQVSRLGMPLTNEVVIPIGQKDFWNSITPYDEITDTTLDEYFYNPELGLYMDDDLFGTAVPALSSLRIQRNSLQAFDFGNGNDGLFALKGSPAVAGTALDDAIFGTLLLPGPGKPRSVDLWPAFHTGVPNFPPYQLATGKEGNPLAAGKPFINNFLPNGGDMLRLNMAVPVTQRDDPNFSSNGLIAAAVLGLTDPNYNSSPDLQMIPNMDGFPNGRRLEDDVTRIELQAVGGAVLAAIGLWYDDYEAGSANPVTEDLVNVLSFSTGVVKNDLPFSNTFPYVAMAHSGTGDCSGVAVEPVVVVDPNSADLELTVDVPSSEFDLYVKVPYTITVTNQGPATAQDINVQAGIPDGEAYGGNEEPSKGEYSLFFENWNIPSLAAGESATLVLRVFPKSDNAVIRNFFQIKTSDKVDPDSTPGNDTDEVADEDDEALVELSLNDEDDFNAPTLEKTSLDDKGTSTSSVKNVFPNPVSDLLNIELKSDQDKRMNVFVYDLSGRIVLETSVNVTKGENTLGVSTTDLNSGIYFLSMPELLNENNRIKFVKE